MSALHLSRQRWVDGTALLLAVAGCASPDLTAPRPGAVRAAAPATRSLTPTERIAFVSNRDGNSEIYAMNPDGSAIIRLTNNAASDVEPAWSRDRRKIAFASTRAGSSFLQIYVMNADGSGVTQLTRSALMNDSPSWSPDRTRIAFRHLQRIVTGLSISFRSDIYVMKADGTGITQLTRTGHESSPAWSSNGARIAFSSSRDDNYEIYVMNADGSGVTRLTRSNTANEFNPAWSPDGTKLAFDRVSAGCCGNFDIYVMNANGSAVTRLTRSSADESEPAWSPDGKRIALVSNRTGNNQIYVMNADGSDTIRRTSDAADDFSPTWARQ